MQHTETWWTDTKIDEPNYQCDEKTVEWTEKKQEHNVVMRIQQQQQPNLVWFWMVFGHFNRSILRFERVFCALFNQFVLPPVKCNCIDVNALVHFLRKTLSSQHRVNVGEVLAIENGHNDKTFAFLQSVDVLCILWRARAEIHVSQCIVIWRNRIRRTSTV